MAKERVTRKGKRSLKVGKNEKLRPEMGLDDALEEVRPSSEYRRIQRVASARWRSLGMNRDFVWETNRLKFQLARALAKYPERLRQFFRPSFFVSRSQQKKANADIDRITEVDLRDLLRRYLRYAVRYEVAFRLYGKAPSFRVRSVGFGGDKLRAEIRENQLYPPSGWDGDNPLEDNLEARDLAAPEGLEKLLTGGRAKYLFIDGNNSSLLREVVDIVYSPDQVSVVRLGGRNPATLFLVGEQVPLNRVWNDLRKVVAASQREVVGRDRRGSTGDIRKLYGVQMAIIRGKRAQKELALQMTGDKPEAAKQSAALESYLSQIKRKLME